MSEARPTIASVAERLLAARGPIQEADLVAELVRAGRTKARQPIPIVTAALRMHPSFIRLVDGRWIHLKSLLDGAIFRHRLSETEIERGVVDADPDLAPLVPVLRALPTSAGEPLSCPSWWLGLQDPWLDPNEPWRRRILGVLPWLDGRSPGDVIQFRIAGGQLEIEIVDDETPIEADRQRIVARIAAATRRTLAVGRRSLGEPGVEIAEIVATALADDPALMESTGQPLGEVIAEAGFLAHARFVGPPGADWTAWDARERSYLRMMRDDEWDLEEAPAFGEDPETRADGIVDLDARRPPRSASGSVPSRLRLLVELDEMDPPVWRRIEVPGDVTLSRLHRIVLLAMGWLGGHLYGFRIGGAAYGEPDEDGDPATIDDRRVRLDRVVALGDAFEHDYDFGDGWCHRIRVEEVVPASAAGPARAKCLDGSGRCPPEDCGGPYGYRELRRALTRPRHERHAEALDLLGENFEAAAFDLDETNEALSWAR